MNVMRNNLNSKKNRSLLGLVWFLGLALIGFPMSNGYAQSASEGKTVFEDECSGCHSIGEGVLSGPDLKGLSDRRSLEWIISFVQSSTALIASGDKDAIAVDMEDEEMPDFDLTDEEIRSVAGYIAFSAAVGSAGGSEEAEVVITAKDIERGRALFQGTERLSGKGPACNACHHVVDDAVIGGGILAKDLTNIFSKKKHAIKKSVTNPGFPVMRKAYEGRAVTEDEAFALVAFLKESSEGENKMPADYGWGLLFAGMGGTVVLWIFYAILWVGRKKVSVNHDIYERQIKASN